MTTTTTTTFAVGTLLPWLWLRLLWWLWSSLLLLGGVGVGVVGRCVSVSVVVCSGVDVST